MWKTRRPSPPVDDLGRRASSVATSVFTCFSFGCRLCGFARYGRDTWTKHNFFVSLLTTVMTLFSFLQKRSGDVVRLDIGFIVYLVTTDEG